MIASNVINQCNKLSYVLLMNVLKDLIFIFILVFNIFMTYETATIKDIVSNFKSNQTFMKNYTIKDKSTVTNISYIESDDFSIHLLNNEFYNSCLGFYTNDDLFILSLNLYFKPEILQTFNVMITNCVQNSSYNSNVFFDPINPNSSALFLSFTNHSIPVYNSIFNPLFCDLPKDFEILKLQVYYKKECDYEYQSILKLIY